MATDRSDIGINRRRPPEFYDWALEERADWIASNRNRVGLLREALLMAEVDLDDRDLAYDSKLTKKELAAILLALE